MIRGKASPYLWAAVILCLAGSVHAQVDTVRVIKVGDTYRALDDTTIYHLGAVVVGARPNRQASANTFQRIPLATIARTDVASVSQLGQLIPSGYVQTNSRGESLLNCRARALTLATGRIRWTPWATWIKLRLSGDEWRSSSRSTAMN